MGQESLSVRFLYETFLGRSILKVLIQPKVSELAGKFLDSRASTCLIPYFQKKNQIRMKGVEIPEGGFPSFNAFFSRKREVQYSHVEDDEMISPCDAFLSILPINKDRVYDIKHTSFTIAELLQDETLAKEYEDGQALIFRLTPAHYHRYCYAVNGTVCKNHKIPGVFHCVRPLATREFPVFAQNAREYQVIETKQFGKIVQMEVGALLVGRITNQELTEEQQVTAGVEKGYFEFGGSTIILLVKKGKLRLNKKLQTNRMENGETSVRQGMKIAIKR